MIVNNVFNVVITLFSVNLRINNGLTSVRDYCIINITDVSPCNVFVVNILFNVICILNIDL
jgi:hypothetical protein